MYTILMNFTNSYTNSNNEIITDWNVMVYSICCTNRLCAYAGVWVYHYSLLTAMNCWKKCLHCFITQSYCTTTVMNAISETIYNAFQEIHWWKISDIMISFLQKISYEHNQISSSCFLLIPPPSVFIILCGRICVSRKQLLLITQISNQFILKVSFILSLQNLPLQNTQIFENILNYFITSFIFINDWRLY